MHLGRVEAHEAWSAFIEATPQKTKAKRWQDGDTESRPRYPQCSLQASPARQNQLKKAQAQLKPEVLQSGLMLDVVETSQGDSDSGQGAPPRRLTSHLELADETSPASLWGCGCMAE